MVEVKAAVSVNDLHRELDLPRRTSCLADDAETTAGNDIRWQAEVHDVEDVEELSTKLDGAELRIPTMTKRSVLNYGEVKIVVCRATECISAESAEASLIRARAAGNIYRDIEE